jgi:glutamine synthetase
MYKPGKEKATRIEHRAPDPACNPYLAFACLLRAGLKGMEDNLKVPGPVEENVYGMSDEERKKRNIKTLPGSLIEAIEIAEKSDLLKEILGEHTFCEFIENKKLEWNNYRRQITEYEIKKYLPVL